MAASADQAGDFIDGGLAALGIEADEIERAVIGAAHQLFWPGILELLSLDLGELRGRARPGPLEGARVSALDLTLRGQAEAIASGEADAAELLDAALARIEERNPAVNAVVETFPERSREMLDAAPEGPLHGVPVVIKDEWPLPWRAQRFGMAEMLDPAAPGESGPYRALRDAGAVIVGVGNMHEAGASSTGNVSVYGPARNPWNTERCPGGSSSGPAAAVGARLVAGAVGADGIGSIRFPAAYCGLTGLKPTFGRSAMEGHHMADATTMIVSGPLCADAADCRLLGSALFGEELAAGDAAGPADRRASGDVVSEDVAPEVREACEAAIEALREETGGEVRKIALADLDASALAAVIIANAEGLGGVTPAAAQRAEPRADPDQPRLRQVPDAAAGRRRGQVGARAHGDAPSAGAALRGGRRARLADGAGGRAAARGAPGRAPLGDRDRGRGQRARRRPRQPDRHPGDQRSGRPQRRRAADRPAAAGAPGGATSCCSTPPRRWSGRTAAAGSSRCRRSPPSPD